MNLKGLWAEFKAFAFKGNMIELAVAVVIGAAFSTVINSLVNDVIMPTVGYAVNTATLAAEKAKTVAESTVNAAASKAGIATSLSATQPASSTEPATAASTAPATATDATAAPSAPTPAPEPTAQAPAPAAAPTAPVQIHLMIGPVNAGAFIGSLLNFLLVAGAVFLVIVKLLGSVMKHVGKPSASSEPTTRECPECLSIIPVKARRCSACTAVVSSNAATA